MSDFEYWVRIYDEQSCIVDDLRILDEMSDEEIGNWVRKHVRRDKQRRIDDTRTV